MEDLLITLLESFGYPVMRQGSLSQGEKYPPKFFTFWENDSTDGKHYDNEPVCVICDCDVNYYSTDPDDTYSTLRAAKKLLKDAGFIIPGEGYDVVSDEETHTGRGMNATFMNFEQESD